ncbi:MAG TPA: GDP-mannose 4,6-dehydratase [Anaerolineae bacterium]|nr:GDP-mannose 4,6-dehydratase [Anaerolineae bacterium]
MSSSEFWKGRRVFVTGCTGILGSWLTQALVARGADVVGLIRDRVPNSDLFRSGAAAHITQVDGDIVDFPLLERALNEYEIDTVFHLAAQALVRVANRMPVGTFETNVRGTWLLLEACRDVKTITRIVVASSDKAYGDQDALPYSEDAPLQGRHPYDVSKSCADLIARAFACTYDMPIAVTRCGNIYGGGDLNWDRIVPGTMRSVLRGEPPIIRSDGSPLRDYLYVDDIVDGYLRLSERLDDRSLHGQAFNFGMDDPKSALEIVESIIAISDHPGLKPLTLNNASHEIQNQYLSSEKARRLLGWQPRYTLAEGLRSTMEWYRAYLSETERPSKMPGILQASQV